MRRPPISASLLLGAFVSAAPLAHGTGSRPLAAPVNAAGDDPAALIVLAQKYDHVAQGVEQDFAKANQLYCRAAKFGHAEAQFRLGWIYANGRAQRRLRHARLEPSTELPACLRRHRTKLDIRGSREVEELVKKLAPRYAIDPQLVMAVILVESGFNAKAVSPKGCVTRTW